MNESAHFRVQAYPARPAGKPVHTAVPARMRDDYQEACAVLPVSPKASAALSRRCLHSILRDCGYIETSVADQVQAAAGSRGRTLPQHLVSSLEAVRDLQNFSGRSVGPQAILQVIDVEPGEANLCLELVEALFEFVYAAPYDAALRGAQFSLA